MKWKGICSSCMVQTSLLVTATMHRSGRRPTSWLYKNLRRRTAWRPGTYTLHALHSIPAWNLWVDLINLMHGHNSQLHQCINKATLVPRPLPDFISQPFSTAMRQICEWPGTRLLICNYSTQHLPSFVYCTKLSVTQHKHMVLKQVIFNLPRQ